MDWVAVLLTGLALALFFGPVVLLLTTFFVLVPLAHLLPRPAMVSRASFDCPFSRRKVDVAFLSAPDSEHPADVLSCSVFADGIRCKKGCLALAESGWSPSPVVPRWALIADGEAFR